MTWEQEREAEFRAKQEAQRERNIQAVQIGQNWAMAQKLWQDFLKTQRQECYNRIELRSYADQFELNQIAAMLQALRNLEDLAALAIFAGEKAERELMTDGEN